RDHDARQQSAVLSYDRAPIGGVDTTEVSAHLAFRLDAHLQERRFACANAASRVVVDGVALREGSGLRQQHCDGEKESCTFHGFVQSEFTLFKELRHAVE